MAKENKKALGRGLGVLFGGDMPIADLTHPTASVLQVPDESPKAGEPETTTEDGQLIQLQVDAIKENPWQPRKVFEEDALTDLAESIREKGMLSPLLVVEKDNGYILVAGERRLRAAKMAGLEEVPAIVRVLSDEEMAQIALIENIQRADLNVIEEARGYASLIKTYQYTQQALADIMGKSRPYIANLLRLLDLPEPVMEALQAGKITAGHARALLGVKDPELAAGLCSDVIAQDLSVRALEALIRDIEQFKLEPKTPDTRATTPKSSASHKALCDQLSEKLQTKVSVGGNAKKGRLVIEFYGDDDLMRVLDALGIELY